MGDIEIRLFRPEDEKEFQRFYSLNLKTGDKFSLFREWRREGLAHSGGEQAVIAKQDDKIVGCVGIVPAALVVGGRRINACWQQDSLVSADMRGMGLGKKLVERSGQHFDVAIAKGSSGAMYGLRKSLGFADVPNSDYLVRVSRIRSGACKLKDRIAECLLLCWKAMLPLPKPDSSIEIRKIDTFDNSFAQLADRVSQERVLRLNKGQAYLNWRYFHCPGRKYKVFRASDGNARGAVVTGVIGEPSEEGWIVDLLCSSRDGACALALLLKALKELEAKGVSRIYAFATQPAARKWLRRLGFLPTGRTPRFTYKIYGQKVDRNVLAQSPWDFWHGDGDVELYM